MRRSRGISEMAGPAGFEPATTRLRAGRSTVLSYGPMLRLSRSLLKGLFSTPSPITRKAWPNIFKRFLQCVLGGTSTFALGPFTANVGAYVIRRAVPIARASWLRSSNSSDFCSIHQLLSNRRGPVLKPSSSYRFTEVSQGHIEKSRSDATIAHS